jgi:glycine/D-amino acid oxidase-like deaminating enzyme
VNHTATGFWLEEAGAVTPAPPLAGDVDADVVVLGGGYTGMWTAWQLLQREPAVQIALLEAGVCGHGPSGRNGGFAETLWTNLPDLVERFGAERAIAAAQASSESVASIGEWCDSEGVDAWYRRSGFLLVSAAEAQDAVLDRLLEAGRAAGVAGTAGNGSGPAHLIELDRDALAERCASPAFRRAVFAPDDATVQPARLALGLRRRLLESGVRIFEHSRVRSLRAGADVVAGTGGGRVRAKAAVLALNAATRGVRPLRSRLAVTSSHIVLTEPVPDVLEQIGWTGGESITDGRTFVHYFRTTPEGRIAFGWGGGPLAFGARLNGRVERSPATASVTAEHLRELFPALEGRKLTHAWGGPIDVSPSHLPQIGTLSDGPVHYAFGFTGNGVGPSHLAGRILAGLALDARDDETRLALVDPAPRAVPPEPLAWAGGSLVRAAFLRRERIEAAGGRADPLTRAVTAAPRALGIHVGR